MINQRVFLIHGWSVRTTQTYQALHLKLAEFGYELQNIYLGRYVSLKDKIEISNLSKELEPKYSYFIKFNSDSDSDLFEYDPASFDITLGPNDITDIIIKDQTTQIDVISSRSPGANLFVFHKGNDPQLLVKWNRNGNLKKKKKLRIK